MRRISVFTIPLMMCVSSTQACEFHMGGFGMGGFSQNHPLMQQHMAQTSMTTLQIKHDRVRNIKVNELSTLPISYVAPPIYHQIIVDISSSKEIVFASPPIMKLNSMSGNYNLNYQAAKPGKFQIIIRVNAMKGEVPVAIEQRVNINVT